MRVGAGDTVGDVLVLSGVAAGAGAVVMYTGARSTLDDAEAAPTLAEYNDLVDDVSTDRTRAILLNSPCNPTGGGRAKWWESVLPWLAALVTSTVLEILHCAGYSFAQDDRLEG